MSTPLRTTRSQVIRIDGLRRRGRLEPGQEFGLGVHGPILEHFGLQIDKPLPLPVNYIVTVAAG